MFSQTPAALTAGSSAARPSSSSASSPGAAGSSSGSTADDSLAAGSTSQPRPPAGSRADPAGLGVPMSANRSSSPSSTGRRGRLLGSGSPGFPPGFTSMTPSTSLYGSAQPR